MKTINKYVALLTFVSVLMVSLIPAESFVLADSEPEISIIIEEMDEVDISDSVPLQEDVLPDSELTVEEEEAVEEEADSLVEAEETDIKPESETVIEEEAEKEQTEAEPEIIVVEETSDEQETSESVLPKDEEKADVQSIINLQELLLEKSLFAAGPSVAEVDGVGYSAINDAITAWQSGTVLKLCSNLNSTVTVPQGTKTLDLNGHNVSRSGVAVKADGSNLTIIDSSGTPGKISNTSSGSGSALDVKNGSLDFNDVTVESRFNGIGLDNCTANIYSGQIRVTSQWKTCINVSNNSKLTIYGGTLWSANHMAIYMVSSEAKIEGGSFKGGISAGVTISGGYFDRDVTSLCAPNAVCSASDDTTKGAYMVETKTPHSHDDTDFTEWTQTNSLPDTEGSYYLASDVTISSTWTVPQGTTNLCLNGHTLKGSGVENVIKVNAGCTLTVCDCGTTGTITGGRSYSGYRYGAGVYVVNGHFILKNGTISGNSLAAGTTGGGGVETEGADAVFDMYGGTICNNEAGYGGGVYIRGGTFSFYDGVISNNKAVSTDGGGVHVYGSASTLNMYGGSIINNTSNAGGGIGVSGGGTLNISGGTISGNTSTQVGGGITNRRTNASGDMNANINISGNPVISGNTYAGSTSNVYLYNGIILNISGALESDASVGVTLQNGTGTFTNGLSGKGSAESFTSDNSEYVVDIYNDEARIALKSLDVTVNGYEGDYDGDAHAITVTAPDGATVKYGVNEGSYTLTENPSYTDVGTYTVYYEVSKAGYNSAYGSATVQISPIDASIKVAPKSKGILKYSGAKQQLIDEGTALGGTLYYALGNDETSPDDAEYKEEIPEAEGVGYYYIWYKVKGDKNHNDTASSYVKTTLAAEDWVTVDGVVYDKDKSPVSNAVVKLLQGNKLVDKTKSDADGGYYFAVPAGLYNIVIEAEDSTVTNMAEISENTTKDIDISNAITQSILDVDSDKSIVVGGLNDEAEAIRIKDNVPSNKDVALKLTVKSISESATEGAQAIDNSAKDRNLEFLDLKVEKKIDSAVTVIDSTENVLEFAIPCPYVNKKELVVYHYHDSQILTLTEISSKAEKADGTFYVDKANKMMYVYLSHFSTIAVGYKPYYSIKSEILLDGFDGNVSVTITKKDTGEKIDEKNNVPLGEISFSNIPKGDYSMTVTWEDGAQNTLTLPFTIN